MTPDGIIQIEREFGVSLPTELHALVAAGRTKVSAIDPCGYLFTFDGQAIGENRSARRGHFYGVAWPDSYILIGADDSGGWFCLDTQRNPAPVIRFDRTDRSFREVAASMSIWLPKVSELYAI
ncbi:MAG: SMI1/KNR4 family protein [Verrucomicrobiota bacterium]